MAWSDVVVKVLDILEPVIKIPPPSSTIIRFGQTVALRTTHDGRYVMANLSDREKLMARAEHVQAWEIFEIVDSLDPFQAVTRKAAHYGDKIALRATNNSRFVGVDGDSAGRELTARVTDVKEWETFILSRPRRKARYRRDNTVCYGNFFALRDYNGNFVTADFNDSGTLRATARRIDSWETFVFIEPSNPR